MVVDQCSSSATALVDQCLASAVALVDQRLASAVAFGDQYVASSLLSSIYDSLTVTDLILMAQKCLSDQVGYILPDIAGHLYLISGHG